jgi:ribosomal protein S18 acetylase RimI-like enzyme
VVTTGYTLQRLGAGDAAPYRELMLQAYALYPEAFTSSPVERAALALSWWEQRLSNAPDAPDCVLAAQAGQELLGVVGMQFDQREKAQHKCTLLGMYVPKAFRGQGIAQALLKAAQAHAMLRPKVSVMQLTVTNGNHTAERLYLSQGFVRYGLEPMAVAVNEGYVEKIHMWKHLERTTP